MSSNKSENREVKSVSAASQPPESKKVDLTTVVKAVAYKDNKETMGYSAKYQYDYNQGLAKSYGWGWNNVSGF